MDDLKELLTGVLSCSPNETDVHDKSDAVKVFLSGTEMRFRVEHVPLLT